MSQTDPQVNANASDPIKHVVLLLLENRSFDQMLGCFQEIYPSLDGIDPSAPTRVNSDGANQYQQLATDVEQLPVDPRYETERVLKQLQDRNSGFVRDFAEFDGATASTDDRQLMMS
jgi:phospholipase C